MCNDVDPSSDAFVSELCITSPGKDILPDLVAGYDGLDISLVLCSQLKPTSCNHRDIPDSSPHRYPTHILSHNHCHHMCICEDMGSQKPLTFTFIHTYPFTLIINIPFFLKKKCMTAVACPHSTWCVRGFNFLNL